MHLTRFDGFDDEGFGSMSGDQAGVPYILDVNTRPRDEPPTNVQHGSKLKVLTVYEWLVPFHGDAAEVVA